MNYLRTILMLLAVLTAGALFVACGDDDEGGNGGEATTAAATPEEEEENGSPTGGAGGGTDLELAAENTTYDVSELTAPAGADITLVFDNDDEGVQHNFSLYETEESEDPLFEGEIITGIDSIDYTFAAPTDPGTYHFHCDIHPTQMTGDFIVE
jgi:plastocyanin